MTDIKQHNNVLFFRPPKGVIQYYILESANGKNQGLFWLQKNTSSPDWIVLPSGNWQLLGGALELKEEDMEKFLDNNNSWGTYKNYVAGVYEFIYIKDSYTSLLIHLEINEDWIVLIPNTK